MPAPPSLKLLDAEASAELAAQERHSTALDAKAGVLLGFAGVLVGLSVANLHGVLGYVATAVAGGAAFFAGWASRPRSFPAISLRSLRDRYLTEGEDDTRQRLLDTRIALYLETRAILRTKARLVGAATYLLGTAVILTVVAGSLLSATPSIAFGTVTCEREGDTVEAVLITGENGEAGDASFSEPAPQVAYQVTLPHGGRYRVNVRCGPVVRPDDLPSLVVTPFLTSDLVSSGSPRDFFCSNSARACYPLS